MGNKLWTCASDGKESIIKELSEVQGHPRSIAMYLAARGIGPEEVESYFNASLDDLSDPLLFPGILTAVERLWKAIINRERILIHGDYDTDGITGTALLSWILERNGAIVTNFLPSRFDDGPGFSSETLVKALETVPGGKVGVLVTVDCGINSSDTNADGQSEDASAMAKRLGIDVIITDHHEPGSILPDTIANINPKLHPELKKLQSLSGVGVAFHVAHAFLKYGIAHDLGGYTTSIRDVLDYVALGTVADIVPLQDENRILVKHGMEMLRQQRRPGVRALIEVAHISSTSRLKPSDITFKLAPRLNAAGRLGSASTALNLMTASKITDAYRHADLLERFNIGRQEKEQEIFSQAKKQVENMPGFFDHFSIIAAGENWHSGVIGIVASRFARDYNRPSIVLTIQGDEAHGSGRSIGGLNLIKVLSKCEHLLTRYGGHPMAVGLGLKTADIPEFQKEFEAGVRSEITQKDLVDTLSYDGDVTLAELDGTFFDYYEKLGPFGHGNPQPCYRIRNAEIIRTFPIRSNHTKGILRDSSGETSEFIAFGKTLELHSVWDIAAVPQITEYYGEKRRQLQILDAHPADIF